MLRCRSKLPLGSVVVLWPDWDRLPNSVGLERLPVLEVKRPQRSIVITPEVDPKRKCGRHLRGGAQWRLAARLWPESPRFGGGHAGDDFVSIAEQQDRFPIGKFHSVVAAIGREMQHAIPESVQPYERLTGCRDQFIDALVLPRPVLFCPLLACGQIRNDGRKLIQLLFKRLGGDPSRFRPGRNPGSVGDGDLTRSRLTTIRMSGEAFEKLSADLCQVV